MEDEKIPLIEKICHFCHEDVDPLDPDVAKPCLCASYLHQACFQSWWKETKAKQCKICKFSYSFYPSKPILDYQKMKKNRSLFKKICLEIFIFVPLTILVNLIPYLWSFDFSPYERDLGTLSMVMLTYGALYTILVTNLMLIAALNYKQISRSREDCSCSCVFFFIILGGGFCAFFPAYLLGSGGYPPEHILYSTFIFICTNVITTVITFYSDTFSCCECELESGKLIYGYFLRIYFLLLYAAYWVVAHMLGIVTLSIFRKYGMTQGVYPYPPSMITAMTGTIITIILLTFVTIIILLFRLFRYFYHFFYPVKVNDDPPRLCSISVTE